MVAQRRSGHVDMSLDLTSRGAGFVALNHEAQDRQARRVTERRQLLGVTIYLGRHGAASNIFEQVLQADRWSRSFRQHRKGSRLLFQKQGAFPWMRRLRLPGARNSARACPLL